MEKVDLKHKTYITGTYNKYVDTCPYCGNKMRTILVENCKGISTDINGNDIMIIECNNCFKSFYFHCNEHMYVCFLNSIKQGLNKFYSE